MTKLVERRKELLDSMMRDAIYEGAVAVLTEHGLNGTTMDRVAAATGTAKGSLYNHFCNKRELLKFVHNKAIEPMREGLEAIAAGALAPAKKLESVVRMWREYLVEHRELFEFLINDSAAKGLLKESEQTARSSAIQRVATIVEQGIQEGAFRPIDATQVAEMFVGAAIGMVEHEFAEGISRTVAETVDTLITVFLSGLSAGEGQLRLGSRE